jgi:hypothetical protein
LPYKKETTDLVLKASEFSVAHGERLVREIETKMALLLAWLDYIETNYKTGTADELISSSVSCARECAAFLSLGLARPVIFGLRAIVDLCLAWLYFKDHAIEWERVNTTGDGFKLKKEIFEYLANNIDGFSARQGILKSIPTRKIEDIYRFLSAHIHGQSLPVLTEIKSLSDIVFPEDNCNETLELAFAAAEYLNDVFLAIYANVWHSLPAIVQQNINSRFISTAQRAKFFDNI